MKYETKFPELVNTNPRTMNTNPRTMNTNYCICKIYLYNILYNIFL